MDAQLAQDKSIREFDRKHGEHYREHGFIYFADGSVRESPYGFILGCEQMNAQIPAEEYRLVSNTLKFARLKLQNAVTAFDELNTRLAHARIAVTEEEIAKLTQLQSAINERRAAVRKAEQAVDNTKLGQGRIQNRQAEEERRQRFEALQQQRRAIKI